MEKKLLSVDAVFCISLTERQDRRDLLSQEFEHCFQNKIEFILVGRDVGNPERGCFSSHKKCAQIVLERGYKRALILEDDAIFTSIDQKQLNSINSFITNYNPDIFFLGGMVCKLRLTWKKNIAACHLLCTHAYILSQEASERFVGCEYDCEPIDHFYNKLFNTKYCCIPLISDQQPDDIVGSDIELFRSTQCDMSTLKTKEFWDKNTTEQNRQINKRRNRRRLIWWRFLSLLGV